LEVFLQATASGYIGGLSLDGRLDGAARQTEGTHRRSLVSDSDRCAADIGGKVGHDISGPFGVISFSIFQALWRSFLLPHGLARS
jgi:hypothetical protein